MDYPPAHLRLIRESRDLCESLRASALELQQQTAASRRVLRASSPLLAGGNHGLRAMGLEPEALSDAEELPTVAGLRRTGGVEWEWRQGRLYTENFKV